jgi:hypothetical protein
MTEEMGHLLMACIHVNASLLAFNRTVKARLPAFDTTSHDGSTWHIRRPAPAGSSTASEASAPVQGITGCLDVDPGAGREPAAGSTRGCRSASRRRSPPRRFLGAP